MPTNQDSINHNNDILVLDDEIITLRLITEILVKEGYTVRPTENAEMAIESALAHPPSLILLDVKMPGINGFEVSRRLGQDERTRGIPIIFVSALQDVADRVRGFEAGGVDFISKPFQELEVLARVKNHLQLRHLQLRFQDLVSERTAELFQINKALQAEINVRKQAEEKLQQYQQRLRALASQLTIVEERERRRIATDLHDQVGQTLALARMQLAALRKSASDDGVTAQFDELSDSMVQAAQDIQNLVFALSSPSMNEIGLSAAISEWLEEKIGKRHGLKTEFIDDGHRRPMTDDKRAILFRNVRELLINVVKHAQANRVSVSMEDTDASLKIVVQDDGIGFDYHGVLQKGGFEKGFGLFSIQERMLDLGGALDIESESGKGCQAILIMPL